MLHFRIIFLQVVLCFRCKYDHEREMARKKKKQKAQMKNHEPSNQPSDNVSNDDTMSIRGYVVNIILYFPNIKSDFRKHLNYILFLIFK